MKKYLALLLAALMLLSCLAGCSSADDTTTPPTETTQDAPQTTDKEDAAPAEPVETADELEGEITFWHSFTQGPRLERIQAAADSFMEKHPKVKINIETYSWADFYTKWTTGLASGNVPDMSTAQAGQVVEMINADAIIPLAGRDGLVILNTSGLLESFAAAGAGGRRLGCVRRQSWRGGGLCRDEARR